MSICHDMLTRFLSYPGRPFWKVDGILSGLALGVQDYLLLDLYLSEYFVYCSTSSNFQPFSSFLVGTWNGIECDYKTLGFSFKI